MNAVKGIRILDTIVAIATMVLNLLRRKNNEDNQSSRN